MIIRFPVREGFIGRGHDGLTYRAERPCSARRPVWVDGRGRIVDSPPPEIWEQLGVWLNDTVGLRPLVEELRPPAVRTAPPDRDTDSDPAESR